MEAGVDSLAATELSSRLGSLTGIAVSPTVVFDHSTSRAIAAYMLDQLERLHGAASLEHGAETAACGSCGVEGAAVVRWVRQCACREGLARAQWARWVHDRLPD
eukprot:3155810-Prymnesium_polylepis.1